MTCFENTDTCSEFVGYFWQHIGGYAVFSKNKYISIWCCHTWPFLEAEGVLVQARAPCTA